MTDQEFLELFQQSNTLLWEHLVQQILEENTAYQQAVAMEDAAEQRYLELELPDRQREIIDDVLKLKERTGLLYADACYLAGMKQVIQLYRALKI